MLSQLLPNEEEALDSFLKFACCMQLSAVQQRADQAARELQKAHIARMAAENRVAELQMRQTTASTSASQQVLILLFTRQHRSSQRRAVFARAT